jgi:importin-5
MSLLSPEIHAELTQLLQALQSADNGIRSQAEDHLQNNWTNTRPEVLLVALVEQIQGSNDNTVRSRPPRVPPPRQYMQLTQLALQTRSFAAVLFRRIASKTRKADSGPTVDMFLSLAADHAIAIRQKLLQSLAVESDKNVRNKISHAVAEVARQYTENSQCPCRLLVSTRSSQHSLTHASLFSRRILAGTSWCPFPT